MELVKYDAACRALTEARAVDEVKDILNKAIAIRLYARQAKNRQLEADAFEIRLRAERRVGEMMAAQPKDKGGHAGLYENPACDRPASLADAGIDKNLANRARKLQALPADQFERVVAEGREAVETAVRKAAGVDLEPSIEDEIDPESYRTAFLLRADQAATFAVYSGPISEEVVEAARTATRAWGCLLKQLEARQ